MYCYNYSGRGVYYNLYRYLLQNKEEGIIKWIIEIVTEKSLKDFM